MSKNRNPVSQWFITFPQSGAVSKQEFKIPDNLWSAVAQETHEDGQPHLHALVCLSNKMTQAEMKRYYDTVYPDDCKRIDYKPVRNLGASATYIVKEDKEPYLTGNQIPNNVLRILKVIPQVPEKWYNKFDEESDVSITQRTRRLLEGRAGSLQSSLETAHQDLISDFFTDDAHDYRYWYDFDTRWGPYTHGHDYKFRNYYDRHVKCGLKT